jgi:MYXO-CTERM domain-containing protein
MKLRAAATALGLVLVSTPAYADSLAAGPPSELLQIDDEWMTGLNQPTGMAFLPDGRLVITLRAGQVLVRMPDGEEVEAGTIAVSTSFQEKGLLNVVAHPDYPNNHLVFFYYTGSGGNGDDNRVVTMELGEDNILDVDSEIRLVEGIAAPLNHDGGGLAILGDYLFIGTGDSGSNTNAHPSEEVVGNYYPTCLTNLNGKVLRLNLDGTIPEDNPLVGQTVTACGSSPGMQPSGTSDQPRTEIFAWGFRNAFRVWGDPKTQNVWVGHVGEITYEMINVVPPAGGVHFGWPFREGGEGRPASACQDYAPNVGDCVDPVYSCESDMANPNNPDVPNDCRSMTGGLILNGCEWPAEFEGHYVFGDYNSEMFWTLQLNDERNDVVAERVEFGSTQGGGPVQFVEHEGALYVITYGGNGHISRIAPQVPEAPCEGMPEPEPEPSGSAGAAGVGGGGSGGAPAAEGGAPTAPDEPSAGGSDDPGPGNAGTNGGPSPEPEPEPSEEPGPNPEPEPMPSTPEPGPNPGPTPTPSSPSGPSPAEPGPAAGGGSGDPEPTTKSDDGGCGCRLGASASGGGAHALTLLLALAGLFALRRRPQA